MLYSSCCGEPTARPEYGLCPACRDHCDFLSEEQEREQTEQSDNKIFNNHKTEGGISYGGGAWQGR